MSLGAAIVGLLLAVAVAAASLAAAGLVALRRPARKLHALGFAGIAAAPAVALAVAIDQPNSSLAVKALLLAAAILAAAPVTTHATAHAIHLRRSNAVRPRRRRP